MKFLKILGLVPLMIAFSFTAALANHCVLGSTAAEQINQIKLRHTLSAQLGEVSAFTGAFTKLNDKNHEIMVKTIVPGLLGPMAKEVPFKIDDDTTMTICAKSTNQCNTSPTGIIGWKMITSLEHIPYFQKAKKDIVVIKDPESNHIVHVQIEYGL